MSSYRAWDVDQPMLLPPSVTEFVPRGHLVHFVRDLAQRALDLSAIHARYSRDPRGNAPYHPAMLTALLIYAYCKGITSSRAIATACEERVDFMALILKTGDGYVQGYNAQAAVDADSQVIVAADVVAQQNDSDQVAPMLDQIEANTGSLPAELSADAGYCSEANLALLDERAVKAYVATGRQKHGAAAATDEIGKKSGARTAAMRARLRRGGYRSRYRLRKQTVEPVFGQIKEARGFRQFRLRGHRKVRGEWNLVCTAHNVLKLAAWAAQNAR